VVVTPQSVPQALPTPPPSELAGQPWLRQCAPRHVPDIRKTNTKHTNGNIFGIINSAWWNLDLLCLVSNLADAHENDTQ
jgi:hypothetical protein